MSHEVGGRRIAGGERDAKHRTLPPVDVKIIRAPKGAPDEKVVPASCQDAIVFNTLPGVTFDATHLTHPRLSFFRRALRGAIF